VLLVVIALVVLVGVVVALVRAGRQDGPQAALLRRPSDQASSAIDRFFERYVDPDGRVVRRDQGGDTVSEGQAYALLLAVAQGNQSRFERVWAWTKQNLQRPDGLLSWKWSKGRVIDPSPATDADLDAARALLMGSRRFQAAHLRDEAVRIGAAVLSNETVDVDGTLVLVAGPWAVEKRVVNPSYVSPCAYAELEEATGDGRWGRLRESSYRMIDDLTADNRLPPDWARVDDAGAHPTGPPDQASKEPQYGLDAARVPFRLAEDCNDRGPQLAARLWPKLRSLHGQGAATAYGLDGAVREGQEHPRGLVAAAAAAQAAGNDNEADQLLRRAREVDARGPSYYGSAWLALAEAFLGAES
jgi:endo-1,4-beta-D-glucanase Y